MTKANRDRGADTERKLVAALRELGWPGAERTVRTGYRTMTRELVDAGDVDGTPGIVWQAKSLRPATRAETCVAGWLDETEQQRAAAGAAVGVLVVRRDHHLASSWWAFVPTSTLFGLADGFSGTLERHAPGAALRAPARFELGDLALLLRAYGFGTPLPAERVAVAPG